MSIKDLIKLAKTKNPNIEMILEDAYKRGMVDGKEYTKKEIIKSIQEER